MISKSLRLATDLTDLIVDSQSTCRGSQLLLHLWARLLSCHHVDRGEAQGRESEMEEHEVRFDKIKYTRAITAGVSPSSSKGNSLE